MTGLRSLRSQLLLWVSVPLLALWIISTLIDHDVAKGFVNLNYDRALLDTALDLGRSVKEADGRPYLDLPQSIIDMLISGERGRYYYRADALAGGYITGEPDLPEPPLDVQSSRVTYYDGTFRDTPVRIVAVRVPIQPGSGRGAIMIQVAERAALRAEFAGQIMLRMMLPQAILVALALLAIWFGVGLGLRALTSVRQEIGSRSHMDLSPIADQNVPAEIRPLVQTMNDLLSRLGTALALQRRFIADAAHQLRTPVAALKVQSELAVRQLHDSEARETLQQLHAAADHASRLVSQLLTMARAEPGSHRSIMREPVNLCLLAREVTEEWVPRALARRIDLGFDTISTPVSISADPFLIREMLNNLIDNAIRYTQADGHVTVRVRLCNDQAALEVEDNGPGIPEPEREKVFERFYRIPGSAVDGCGLGLAIVREIAASHDATVSMNAGAGNSGTRVTIRFPLTR